MLARTNLQAVLRRLGVLQEHMKVQDQAVFEELFKNVWADHADMISIQYTGTGALKTDFTRLGKRGLGGSNPYFMEHRLLPKMTFLNSPSLQDGQEDQDGTSGRRPPVPHTLL